MQRRKPNAPFKPPRPFSAKTETPQESLFVPSLPTRAPDQPVKPLRPLKRLKVDINRVATNTAPQIDLAKTGKIEEASENALSQSSGSRFYTVQWRKRSNKKNKLWEGDGYIVVSLSGTTLKIESNSKTYRPAGRSKSTEVDGLLRFGQYEAEVDSEVTREEIAQMCEPTSSSSPVKPAAFTPISEMVKKPMKKLETLPNERLELPAPSLADAQTIYVDATLTAHLRPHQKEGVQFLYDCLVGFRSLKYCGALLADEMGLGKTLMSICVIWTLLKQSPFADSSSVVKKVLICCPVTLIDNWRREFKKWLDINRIGVLALNNKQQTATKDKQDIVNFGKTNVYQVLIMSYEKVLSCAQELTSVGVDLLVCDEGHRLKSGSNKVLSVLNRLNVQRKMVLTGTPIQNDLNEFYNLVNFVNPGILGTQSEFQKAYLRPILRARDVNCMSKETIKDGKVKSAQLIELTKQFVLRRTKAVIRNYLTTKTDLVVFCPPTTLQKRQFLLVLRSLEFNTMLNAKSKDVLSMINVFRKICNSPALVENDTLFNLLVSQTNDEGINMSTLANRTAGSKINVLVPLLLEFQKAGEKCVLVSNFTQTLDLLERVLLKLNISYLRLDGSTPLNTRDGLVNTFNKQQTHRAFLLSAKAGGVGLNLIGASRLVLFDNDWNPLVDLQAMARIHRDGQTKPVYIYRLFTTGSIDEKIFQRQLMKSNLSEMFIDDNVDSTLNIFDYDDLRDLFSTPETNCNTHDLLECECSGTGESVDLDKADACDTDEDSDTELPSSGWMSALEFKELDGSQVAKKQSIRSALSNYKHFDGESFAANLDTGDAVLNKLLINMGGDKPTYVFSKVTESEAVS